MTFIRFENSQIVFSYLEELLVLLIVDFDSNLVNDFQSLRQTKEMITKALRGNLSQENLEENFFDVVFVCDEIFSLGYRTNLTEGFAENLVEMYSNNERIFDEL